MSPFVSLLSTARRRLLRARALAGALLPLVAIPSAVVGETYYQAVNHNGSGDWNTLSHWNTNGSRTPEGASPASIDRNDDFIANNRGWILRTPTGVNTFAGGSITLLGTHMLEVRSASSMSTVPYLIASGTPSVRAAYKSSTLTINRLRIDSGELELRGHKSASPDFNVTLGTLEGKGSLKTTGTPRGTLILFLLDATGFEGAFTVESGKVRFMTPVSSGGVFVVPVASDVTFDHDAEFAGLTVDDTVYSPGTYSAASLGFLGSGSVKVRPPPASR
jgi:hypothetical protein